MIYLVLILSLFSGISQACVTSPQKIIPTKELGFEFKEESFSACLNCKVISILIPVSYKNKPAAHAVFTVFQNEKIVSKSLVPFNKGINENEFIGIVGDTNYFNYNVMIEYGNYRCMSYEFNYSGGKSDSH